LPVIAFAIFHAALPSVLIECWQFVYYYLGSSVKHCFTLDEMKGKVLVVN